MPVIALPFSYVITYIFGLLLCDARDKTKTKYEMMLKHKNLTDKNTTEAILLDQ